METSLMSESLVDESDVEETVTQVLTQFVEDGDDQTVMSVELLQEKVELLLGYLAGSLSKWHIRLVHRLGDCSSQRIPRQCTLHSLGHPKTLNLLLLPDTVLVMVWYGMTQATQFSTTLAS